jgi:rhodanese-related sulfurtransferase
MMGGTEMTTIAELVASARGRIEELDPEGFTAEAARPDTVVVDVREADERLDGIITGAVHVPRGILEFRADPASPYHDERLHPGRRVLLHCASGGRSALAAETLRSLGYGDVAHLAGGITAWREAGLPVMNEVVSPG